MRKFDDFFDEQMKDPEFKTEWNKKSNYKFIEKTSRWYGYDIKN